MFTLSQQKKMRLIRGASFALCAVLVVAAFGLTTAYDAIRIIVFGGFLVLTVLAFNQHYKVEGLFLLGAAVVFNPFMPFVFPRHLWVIIDMIFATAVGIFALWATDPFKKGTRFEDYVAGCFPEPKFTIKDRTRDISKFMERLVESDRNPDFVFRNNENGKVFAVECKWRTQWWNKRGVWGLQWNAYQARAYTQYEKETGTPVFIAFGIGGTPQEPHEVYFVRLTGLKGEFIEKSIITSGKMPAMMH